MEIVQIEINPCLKTTLWSTQRIPGPENITITCVCADILMRKKHLLHLIMYASSVHHASYLIICLKGKFIFVSDCFF